MVRVEIRQNTDNVILATVESGPDRVRVVGPWERWLELAPHRGLPSGRPVSPDTDPDEWVRGLIVAFRSPDVAARIIYDDDPLPEDDPVDLRAAVAV